MKKNISLLLFILSHFCLLAQVAVSSPPSKLLKNRFFSSYGVTIFAEYMTTKAHKVDQLFFYGTSSNGTPLVDTLPSYEIGHGITLMTMTLELRWNLYDYLDKGSVSVSTPLAASFNFLDRSAMLGSLTFPIIFDANYGMHSTYNNIDKYGVHVGMGFQGILAGLLAMSDLNSNSPDFWMQPVARMGAKFPIGKKNCFFDAYYGIGKKYSTIETHDHLTNENTYSVIHSKFYAKLVFGWLINYD